MSIKILTKNSIDITNIDGARQNHFSAGMRSGIVKGALNEGRFFASASNIIALDTCELRISGHRVVIDSSQYISLTNKPANDTRYSMIAEISVNSSSVPTFRLFIQSSNTDLTRDNLFTTNTGAGTYQLEIGKFTLSTAGDITDVIRTADLITGGSDFVNIGNVTTKTLSSADKAVVKVTSSQDEKEKNYLNFQFEIPQGAKGERGLQGIQGIKGDSGVASGVVLSNEYGTSDENGYTQQAVNNLVSNPNLLINGDFRVNQRGQTSYSTANKYGVDRWQLRGNGLTFDVATRTLTNTASELWCYLTQILEKIDLFGKTVTVSYSVGGEIYSGTATIPTAVPTESTSFIYVNNPNGDVELRYYKELGLFAVQFGVKPSSSYSIDYVKLEIGSVATPLSPRPYAEELVMCQRYYKQFVAQFVAKDGYGIYSPINYEPMRTTPTIKFYAWSGGVSQSTTESTLYDKTDGLLIDLNGRTVQYSEKGSFTINDPTGTFTTNHLMCAKFKLDAEIY